MDFFCFPCGFFCTNLSELKLMLHILTYNTPVFFTLSFSLLKEQFDTLGNFGILSFLAEKINGMIPVWIWNYSQHRNWLKSRKLNNVNENLFFYSTLTYTICDEAFVVKDKLNMLGINLACLRDHQIGFGKKLQIHLFPRESLVRLRYFL